MKLIIKTFFWVAIFSIGFQMLASFKSINDALVAPPLVTPTTIIR